jgi:hypothetical protein
MDSFSKSNTFSVDNIRRNVRLPSSQNDFSSNTEHPIQDVNEFRNYSNSLKIGILDLVDELCSRSSHRAKSIEQVESQAQQSFYQQNLAQYAQTIKKLSQELEESKATLSHFKNHTADEISNASPEMLASLENHHSSILNFIQEEKIRRLTAQRQLDES